MCFYFKIVYSVATSGLTLVLFREFLKCQIDIESCESTTTFIPPKTGRPLLYLNIFFNISFHGRRVRVDLLSYSCSFFEKKKNDTVSWSEMNRLNFTKSSHVFVKCTCCNWKDWRYSRFYCLTSAVLLDKPFYERNMKLFFKKNQSTVMMVTLLQAV